LFFRGDKGMKKRIALCAVLLLLSVTYPLVHTLEAATDEIRIAVTEEHSGHFASVDYAQELGFYREFQVTPKILYYTSGGDAVKAVAEDQADFLISCNPTTVALSVKSGAAISIIASDGPSPLAGIYILVRNDSPIKSLSDLNGKTIGISSQNSESHIVAQLLAAKAKIKLDYKPLGPNRLAYLVEGKIEAIVLFPDFTFRALAGGKVRALVDIPAELGRMGDSVIVASNKSIATKKEAIGNALKAIFKAADYIKKNHKEAIAFLAKFTGQDEKVATMCHQVLLSTRSTDGFITKDGIDNQYGMMRQIGIKLDLPPTDKYFTGQFVPVRY
jgi:ABC-type nitrate/sulfonate/bicarbonate transport system substrate-binding protein